MAVIHGRPYTAPVLVKFTLRPNGEVISEVVDRREYLPKVVYEITDRLGRSEAGKVPPAPKPRWGH